MSGGELRVEVEVWNEGVRGWEKALELVDDGWEHGAWAFSFLSRFCTAW